MKVWTSAEIPGRTVKMTQGAAMAMTAVDWRRGNDADDQLLAELPPDAKFNPHFWCAYSPAGRKVLTRSGTHPSETLLLNSVPVKTAPSFFWPPVFSPDGSRYLFALRREDATGVVIDGDKTSPPFKECDSLSFSRDGKRWACHTRHKTGARMLVDGKLEDEFHAIQQGSFSGGRFAYLAFTKELQPLLVVDGKGTPATAGTLLLPSPDGRIATLRARKELTALLGMARA